MIALQTSIAMQRAIVNQVMTKHATCCSNAVQAPGWIALGVSPQAQHCVSRTSMLLGDSRVGYHLSWETGLCILSLLLLRFAWASPGPGSPSYRSQICSSISDHSVERLRYSMACPLAHEAQVCISRCPVGNEEGRQTSTALAKADLHLLHLVWKL